MGCVGDYEVVEQSWTYAGGGNPFTYTISAPSGKVILGATLFNNDSFPVLNYGSWPSSDGTSWSFKVGTTVGITYTIRATCANMG